MNLRFSKIIGFKEIRIHVLRVRNIFLRFLHAKRLHFLPSKIFSKRIYLLARVLHDQDTRNHIDLFIITENIYEMHKVLS